MLCSFLELHGPKYSLPTCNCSFLAIGSKWISVATYPTWKIKVIYTNGHRIMPFSTCSDLILQVQHMPNFAILSVHSW